MVARVNEHIPTYQAGVRSRRNCTDQVLSITTFIEAGFHEEKLQLSVGLTVAYHSVCWQGHLYEFLRITADRKLTQLLNNKSNKSIRTDRIFLKDAVFNSAVKLSSFMLAVFPGFNTSIIMEMSVLRFLISPPDHVGNFCWMSKNGRINNLLKT